MVGESGGWEHQLSQVEETRAQDGLLMGKHWPVMDSNMFANDSIWRVLLETAARAPSPHNTQPWRLRIIDDRRADLFIDRKRVLPDEDITGCFMICAMGIFCETLKGVASHHKLKLKCDFAQPSLDDALNLFARLTLSDDKSVLSPFPKELYLKRKTSRLPNNRAPVPADVLNALAGVVDDSGQHFAFLSEPALIKWIMDLNLRTTFVDMNHAPYRKEFHKWVRTSKQKSMESRDGLDARCMNLTPLEFWMNANFYRMYRWPIVSSLIKRWYDFRVGHVQHIGYIKGSFWDYSSATAAGQFLIKLWMEMARFDIVIHPLGNLVTNIQARKKLENELGEENIWLVFRFGYTNMTAL